MRSLGTYRRHYPGGTGKRRWSLDHFPMAAFTIRSWLGSRINNFEACSAFTHVTVCPVAKSPESDPLHPRLRRIRYLLHRSDCYRLERPSCRTGLAPARSHRLATAHFEECSGHGEEISKRMFFNATPAGLLCGQQRLTLQSFVKGLRSSECVSNVRADVLPSDMSFEFRLMHQFGGLRSRTA